jgi:hypothetical protein
MRAEQAAQNAKNDDRFERRLTAFMHDSTKNDSNETPDDNTATRHQHRSKKKHSSRQYKNRTATYGSTMDTEHDTFRVTDDKRRPMETDRTMFSQPRPQIMDGPPVYTGPPHTKPTETDDELDEYQHPPSANTGFLYHTSTSAKFSAEETEEDDQDYDSHSTQDQSDNTEYSTNAKYSTPPLTLEWLPDGNGNNDGKVWSSDLETEHNAPAHDTTNHTGFNPSSSTTTRIANDENADIESLGTSESDDSNYQHSPRTTHNDLALKAFYRPPRVTQLLHPTTDSTPTMTNISDKRSREEKLAKGRQRLQNSLLKVQEAADAKLDLATHAACPVTSPSPSPPNGIQPVQLRIKGNPSTQAPWNIVGSSKRKAKDTPARKHQAHIRKNNQIRMFKKQIVSARDAASSGAAGPQN